MESTKVTSVSSTAIAMAAVRACESLRDDGLFVDRFAAKLAGEEAVNRAVSLVQSNDEKGRPFGQVRTRFLDDFLLAHVEECCQVVLLGAGLDARAYRLDLPQSLKFFELDKPNIIEYKNEILATSIPQCDRRTIATNLGEATWVDRLVKQGFVQELPTVWILEGFLYYLEKARVLDLMGKVNRLSAVGSYLGCDLINTVVCNGSNEWAKMWHFGCDEPEMFFQGLGWEATAVQPNDPEASYGRYTFKFPPRDDLEGAHIFFVTAVKGAE